MIKISTVSAAIFLIACSCSAAFADDDDYNLNTQVVSQGKAAVDHQNWGNFKSYFTKQTVGTKANLVGVAVIKPGMEIHPPHKHADEEYLMVIEGNGVWHVKGKEFPAKAGDILYAKPWDIHGIKNTGKTPLKFVVWKWSSKGTKEQ